MAHSKEGLKEGEMGAGEGARNCSYMIGGKAEYEAWAVVNEATPPQTATEGKGERGEEMKLNTFNCMSRLGFTVTISDLVSFWVGSRTTTLQRWHCHLIARPTMVGIFQYYHHNHQHQQLIQVLETGSIASLKSNTAPFHTS